MRKGGVGLLFGILLLAGVMIWVAGSQKPSGSKFEVDFLDVGQGDAIYMRAPEGNDILVDGGPGKRVLEELGKVMPFWDKELDLVILTHNHADHLQGLLEVLKRYEVKEVWISGAVHTTSEYLEFLQILKDKKIKTLIVKNGVEKKYGELEGRVIYPIRSWQGERPTDQHEATVVTRWVYGKFSVLLTGDLGFDQLNEIIDSGEYLKSTILKVPHHGSSTGLNKEFLELVSPKIAVIMVGSNNRYGHPTETILRMLEDFGTRIYRTDKDGVVRFESDGINYSMD